MGRVFRALDTTTGTEVALKVMPDHLRADGEVTARFRDEAALLEKCAHPHVVRLLDSGTDPATGAHYMVMELMAGSLKMWSHRPLPLPRILTWMRAACQAVAHAHSLGIYHRDLKPSNLLLAPDVTLKVADFGIAHAIPTTEETGTAPPPNVTLAAADLHALGDILYALLTGQPPRRNCLPPSQIASRPRWCDRLCDRASAAHPRAAFTSAAEMDAALAVAEDPPSAKGVESQHRPTPHRSAPQKPRTEQLDKNAKPGTDPHPAKTPVPWKRNPSLMAAMSCAPI